MKSLLILFGCALMASTCQSIEFEKNPPFSVVKSAYNYWIGGQPGISGINVFMEYKANTNIKFDSIYFRNKRGSVDVYEDVDRRYIIGRISTSKKIAPSLGEASATKEKSTNKFDLNDNEAVLSYTINDKIQYYKLSNLKETDQLYFK